MGLEGINLSLLLLNARISVPYVCGCTICNICAFDCTGQQTRDELEERVRLAEAKAATAAAESERLIAQQHTMKTKMSAMKWRANAHVRAVERKFSTESDTSGGLQVELEKERVKAEELQKKLDLLENLSNLDVMSMTEYQVCGLWGDRVFKTRQCN